MSGKKYQVFVTSFTPEQDAYLRRLAEQSGEPISTTIRRIVEEKRKTDPAIHIQVARAEQTEQVAA